MAVDQGVRTITPDATPRDVQVITIPDVTVDAWVDPCLDLQNTDELYCQCNPRCCQEQTWYCPPLGTEILAKNAILDICGEDLIPCDRNADPSCPPAEVIYESDCNHAFDCCLLPPCSLIVYYRVSKHCFSFSAISVASSFRVALLKTCGCTIIPKDASKKETKKSVNGNLIGFR